jgi:hypothetical protein
MVQLIPFRVTLRQRAVFNMHKVFGGCSKAMRKRTRQARGRLE